MIYPLREKIFQATPVKTVPPIPELVRGLEKNFCKTYFFAFFVTYHLREKNFSARLPKYPPELTS